MDAACYLGLRLFSSYSRVSVRAISSRFQARFASQRIAYSYIVKRTSYVVGTVRASSIKCYGKPSPYWQTWITQSLDWSLVLQGCYWRAYSFQSNLKDFMMSIASSCPCRHPTSCENVVDADRGRGLLGFYICLHQAVGGGKVDTMPLPSSWLITESTRVIQDH